MIANRITDDPSHAFEDTAYTDQELAAGLRARDEWLSAVFYRRFAPRMQTIAMRITRCEQEAQDAVQDAMISALQSIHSFNGESRISTWLHRIVVNAALMRLRKRSRRVLASAASETARIEDRPAGCLDAFASAADHEISQLVRECVEALPSSYRQIIQLRDMEEHDTSTTARLLDCSEANVKTRLHRARRSLRDLLEPYALCA